MAAVCRMPPPAPMTAAHHFGRVSGDSELIVKRGTEIVGKLSIVSIEPRLTVADILQNTLKPGARILPGDKVIFEKLQN